jgi:hypothetical protein
LFDWERLMMKFKNYLFFGALFVGSGVYASQYSFAAQGYINLFNYTNESLEKSFFKGSSPSDLIEGKVYLGKMKNGICFSSGTLVSYTQSRYGFQDVDYLDVGDIMHVGSNNCLVSQIKNYGNAACFLFGAKLIFDSAKRPVAFDEQSIYYTNC